MVIKRNLELENLKSEFSSLKTENLVLKNQLKTLLEEVKISKGEKEFKIVDAIGVMDDEISFRIFNNNLIINILKPELSSVKGIKNIIEGIRILLILVWEKLLYIYPYLSSDEKLTKICFDKLNKTTQIFYSNWDNFITVKKSDHEKIKRNLELENLKSEFSSLETENLILKNHLETLLEEVNISKGEKEFITFAPINIIDEQLFLSIYNDKKREEILNQKLKTKTDIKIDIEIISSLLMFFNKNFVLILPYLKENRNLKLKCFKELDNPVETFYKHWSQFAYLEDKDDLLNQYYIGRKKANEIFSQL